MKDELVIKCKNCGQQIGAKFLDDMFVVGGLIVREVHGICVCCGTAFHYELNDDKLDQLLVRMSNGKRRKK